MSDIHPNTQEAYKLFHEGMLAFARAEQAGMRIDAEYCERKKTEITDQIEDLETQIMKSNFGRHWKHSMGPGFKLTSNQQLATYLYKIKKLTPIKMAESGKMGATDDEALSKLNIPELNQLLDMRKLIKIRDTYLDAFIREQVNGFIHPFFNLHLVITFRSSSDSPNFQNIPKRDKRAMKLVRGAIYPRLGHQFLSMDFSGIEVRMACIYTQDKKLIYDTVHGDMHKDMAIELYMLDGLDKHHDGEKNLRQGGKNGFVFPEFYGDYYGNCVQGLLEWAKVSYLTDGTPALVHMQDKKLITLHEDGTVRNFDNFTKHVQHVEDMFWNERYRTYKEWKNKTWADYQKTGYVDLKTGFRCGGLMGKKDVCNYPLQGSAFHCLLWTFNETDRWMRKEQTKSRLVSQVHDELTSDCPPEETRMVAGQINRIASQALPKHWPWINVPLEIEAEVAPVDGNWGQKEFYPLEPK